VADEAEDGLAANGYAQSRDEMTSRAAALCDKATIVGQAKRGLPQNTIVVHSRYSGRQHRHN
jgi:hypothetical protein